MFISQKQLDCLSTIFSFNQVEVLENKIDFQKQELIVNNYR
ncbi:hypothetical protein B4088_6083 [Bacillus cereus]|uniref:Uncharacterized protein n=1 Tax=Bacillus cereus TaxID=1396 RepID=A0A164KRX8_BACCE|nr:hypothetical protein B4088_6083 [Bacillus cereus]